MKNIKEKILNSEAAGLLMMMKSRDLGYLINIFPLTVDILVINIIFNQKGSGKWKKIY